MSGRLIVWGSTAEAAIRVRASLPSSWIVSAISGENEVRPFPWPACVVLAIGDRKTVDPLCVRLVETLTNARDPIPVVIAGDPGPELIRLTARHSLWDIVWPSELEARLPLAVGRLRVRSELQKTHAVLNRHGGTKSALRVASSELTNSQSLVRSVAELAHRCGYNRSTLAREWQDARRAGLRLPPTLEDYVDWALVLSIAAIARRDRKWGWAADQLGLHLQKIARQCRRLAELRLSDLTMLNGVVAFERFEERVVRPLQGSMGATKTA